MSDEPRDERLIPPPFKNEVMCKLIERDKLTLITEELERLRKLNSDYKQQIHELRKRCESLVREMESLRAERPGTPVVRHFDGINQEPQED